MSSTMSHNFSNAAGRRARAFTLVEILIVIIILGILATIVIPQFTSASQQAKENSLRDDLRFMRTQVGVFKAQHRDVAPGYPGGDRTAAPDEATMVDHLMLHTDEGCTTSTTASSVFKFGPYLSRMPANPLNNLTTVLVVGNGASIPAPDDSTGWIYKPQTQEFLSNNTGSDAGGTPYSSY